jgi:hypothetical protein
MSSSSAREEPNMTIRPKRSASTSGIEVSGGKVMASYALGGNELVGRARQERSPWVRTGRVHSATAEGPHVIWEGAPRPTLARVAWMPSTPDWSVCAGLPVVLAFAEGDEARPIVLGLLEAPPAPAESAPVQAPDVLRLESGRELVIECGKARIHLRADGKIEIRGEYLISRAAVTNKIKGGSVQIN